MDRMNVEIGSSIHEFEASGGSEWVIDNEAGVIRGHARGFTDIIVDPLKDEATGTKHDAATLMAKAPSGDFQFSADVEVDFKTSFDGGVLFVRANARTWAKLCFEFAPNRGPRVISVVNKGGSSDDAYAFPVEETSIRLRISRKRHVYAFHASKDGRDWVHVRWFSFEDGAGPVEIGFVAQAPNAATCLSTFSRIALTETSIGDFHDGR